jgi:hypothetical protein
MTNTDTLDNHFRGEIRDVQTTAPASPQRDDMDLVEMARWGLNYLRGNPDPARGYECKFALGPLGIPCHVPISPSNKHGFDVVSLGDTDSRMDGQYLHMRLMTGDAEPDAVERGVRGRLLGYLRDDGLSWVNPGAAIGETIDEEWVMSWTTAKTLFGLSETYEQMRAGKTTASNNGGTPSPRQLFEGLRSMALWDGPRAYYPGIAPYKDGQWLRRGWCATHARNYPFIVEPLVRYWECTGDGEALDLAKAFAEGFLADSQKDMGELHIDSETGEFQNHVHLHTHATWGMAHLGAALGERRYLDWVDKAYRFVLAQGTDYGWYPEFIPQGEWRTEICVVGDMVANGAWLAQGGRPDYWDHVERTIRNEIRRSQFFLTPDFLELFARLHKDKPASVVDAAMVDLRKIEGGFVAQSTFNDWVGYPEKVGQPGMYNNGIQMMGCCPPEGMHALWEAYLGVVQQQGGAVWVNMNLHRDHAAAKVAAYSPEAGRMDVQAKTPGRYMLRPPAWAPRDQVKLRVSGLPEKRGQTPISNGEIGVSPRFSGLHFSWAGPQNAYVQIDHVAAGDLLTLTWPVPKFTQIFQPISVPGRSEKFTVSWCGNEVLDVSPAAKYLPMFKR